MITAVIRSTGDAAALAATLALLIPAVAEGVVGHAVLVGDAEDDVAVRFADETGASYVRAGPAAAWRSGAEAARGDWLLLLDAGDLPEPHWLAGIERHLLAAPGAPALLPLSGFGALPERLALLLAGRAIRAGLLAPKPQILAGRLARVPRRLRVRRERAAVGGA